MHHHDWYVADQEDGKALALIKDLTKGTELEERNSREYNTLVKRVHRSITHIVDNELCPSSFLEWSDGKFQKAKCLKDCWRNRESYWRHAQLSSKRPGNAPREHDEYDIDAVLSNNEEPSLLVASPNRTPSKIKGPIKAVNKVRPSSHLPYKCLN